jgi:hypothetical protein
MRSGLTNHPSSADLTSAPLTAIALHNKKEKGNKSVSRTRKEICQKVPCICRNWALKSRARRRAQRFWPEIAPIRTIFSSCQKPPLYFRLTPLTRRVRTVRNLKGKRYHHPTLPLPERATASPRSRCTLRAADKRHRLPAIWISLSVDWTRSCRDRSPASRPPIPALRAGAKVIIFKCPMSSPNKFITFCTLTLSPIVGSPRQIGTTNVGELTWYPVLKA